MNEAVIDALVLIGNAIKEECEPNVAEPMELKRWMVVRTIKALELFEDEWERLSENRGRKIPETPVSNEGAVRGNT